MPHDDNFKGLLGDYMKPAKDDGFSDNVMARIDAQNAADNADYPFYRRAAICGAAFIGGVFAAIQLPKLSAILPEVTVPASDLSLAEMGTSLSYNGTMVAVIALIACVIWLAMDGRSAELL